MEIKNIIQKAKANISKSMFERINGVDIEKLSTSELLRQVRLLPSLFIIMLICTILYLIFALVFAIGFDEEIAFYSLFFFAGGIVASILIFIFPKRLKCVKSVLEMREISDEDRKAGDKKLKETKKAGLIGIIVIVAVSLAFFFVLISGGFSGSSGRKCELCDKRTATKGDYCSECYDRLKHFQSVWG